jgi:hypothetical protein
MEKEFVPYELALKLKELGFKERCLTYYGGDKPMIYDDLTIHGCDHNTLFLNWTSRPTFSQAFRWFREKYQLHSTITSISQESWQWHITKPGESLGKMYEEDFYTYEETELACLDKLIEIIETKKED